MRQQRQQQQQYQGSRRRGRVMFTGTAVSTGQRFAASDDADKPTRRL